MFTVCSCSIPARTSVLVVLHFCTFSLFLMFFISPVLCWFSLQSAAALKCPSSDWQRRSVRLFLADKTSPAPVASTEPAVSDVTATPNKTAPLLKPSLLQMSLLQQSLGSRELLKEMWYSQPLFQKVRLRDVSCCCYRSVVCRRHSRSVDLGRAHLRVSITFLCFRR